MKIRRGNGWCFFRCALHQLGEDGKAGNTQCHRVESTQAFCFVLDDKTDTTLRDIDVFFS